MHKLGQRHFTLTRGLDLIKMAAVRLGKSVLRLSSFRVMCVNLDYNIIQANKIHTAYPLSTGIGNMN